MKLALASDIHLEFGDWYPTNPEKADVLILAGDILVANAFQKANDPLHKMFKQFLENTKKEYEHVIYISGNHEYYHGNFQLVPEILKSICDKLGIVFLNDEEYNLGDYTFLGGTLWTDMNSEDRSTIYRIKNSMNDFRLIKYHNMLFSPNDAIAHHKKFLGQIANSIEKNPDRKYIVLSHHAPSRLSTKPKYSDDWEMNGGYSSHLESFIENHPQILVWFHGHTHDNFDYMIGKTRIVCNPRGYVEYERLSNDLEPYVPKIIEV